GVTKVPFVIAGPFTESGEKAHFDLSLGRMEPHKALNSLNLSLQVVKPGETHRRTFLSRIDGSVQYYSLVPAIPDAKTTPGLTLTLHGAAVEASGQAACFSRKNWTHTIAATNRRPYGFDWEDWGRLDALEVLHE